MFFLPKYVNDLRNETRKLRIYTQQLERSIKTQKKKNENSEEKNAALKKKQKELEEENRKLRELLEKAEVTIKTYKQMLFDKHKQTEITEAIPKEKGKDKKETKEKDQAKNSKKK